VLETAIGDVGGLVPDLDQLRYLGDAVSGADPEDNGAVAEVQLRMLEQLGLPGRYVMGNHDLDPPRSRDILEMPSYDRVRERPGWPTTESPEEFYFTDELGSHTVLLLSDHVSPDLEWAVTHGRLRMDESAYPYTEADYRAAIEPVTAPGRPLILAGHNAFSGGNRPASRTGSCRSPPAR